MSIDYAKDGSFALHIGSDKLSRGLRPSKRMPRNNEFLIECKGAVGRDGVLQVIDNLTRIDTSALSDAVFPYPQIFVFTNMIIVCTDTKIYEWVNGSLSGVKLTVVAGNTWAAVDFHDYVYMSNGKVAVIRAIDGTYSVRTDIPTATSILNFNGQVIISSPNAGFISPPPPPGADKAIFGYGYNDEGSLSITNLVSNTGVVATDTASVGTARFYLAATGYGTDKAIFGYGHASGAVSITNLVSNTGVVASDTAGVGTARSGLAAAGYGGDKAIFGYGSGLASMTNLVSNTGVVSENTTGVGTARQFLAAAGYGGDKAIFGYGWTVFIYVSITNLVSNSGVVSADTTGVGTARGGLAAAGYGGDKAIFGYGYASGAVSITNLVSNTGVVASDTAGVGSPRNSLAAAGYGGNKAIFGYGYADANLAMTNLVSNTGVVASDTTGVGTARYALAAAGYGTQ